MRWSVVGDRTRREAFRQALGAFARDMFLLGAQPGEVLAEAHFRGDEIISGLLRGEPRAPFWDDPARLAAHRREPSGWIREDGPLGVGSDAGIANKARLHEIFQRFLAEEMRGIPKDVCPELDALYAFLYRTVPVVLAGEWRAVRSVVPGAGGSL